MVWCGVVFGLSCLIDLFPSHLLFRITIIAVCACLPEPRGKHMLPLSLRSLPVVYRRRFDCSAERLNSRR